ncbi:hypothetical protein DHEL01_v206006 [Diaporthe helianthi]|uniref:Uncharacterized protein n=1 Tax=Diaporthe helianthi TaxID=158607 RepID=A0A2P5HZB7_DIAHE|nr:hypothetical protein DHEL01_v206006 [Diaporthe helianthi]
MVSFFGLKFGGDKKRKEIEALQPLPPPPQWKNDRTEVLLQCSGMLSPSSSRPGTAYSSRSSARRPFAAGENRNSAANSIWDHHDTEFRGVGAGRIGSSASISAGSGPFTPGHGLKSFGSETNLQWSLGARNGSSTSLAVPRLPFGGGGGAVGPRPGSAQSMHNGRERPRVSLLDTSLVSDLTPGDAGLQRSPLGQLEFMSPVRSDSESLLGEDPEKFAQGISDRVTHEDKTARMKNELEQRRRIQAELESTVRRNSEASRPKTAGGYPSPPASVTSDYVVPSVLVSGQRSGSFAGAASREARPASSGRDNLSSHLTPAPGPRRQDSATGSMRPVSRGGQPSVEGPQPSSRSPLSSVAPAMEGRSAIRGRRQTADNLSPASSGSRAQPSREPVRGATVPAVMPQRSPLFQQSNPFDTHKADGPREDEDGDEQPQIDYRAANAPYGIPSPPLSNRQRTSEEAESRPVIRSVMAKRDTLVVGGPPRQSLGLQIDEFEKTLQQAQTMTALEKGPSTRTVSRSRGDSDGGSSNYSDISESPMTIEPPLISPKPFPLTPRPTTPSARSTSYSRDILRPIGPALGPRLGIQPGNVGSITPTSMQQGDQTREEMKGSPAGRRRPTGAMPVKRPTVDEYGNVRVNAVASMANRMIRRPSPDEYGVQIKRTDSPFRTESPILKEVRNMSGTDTSSDGLSSHNTSRSNSPLPNHSHSVFSPPPLAKRPFPAPGSGHGPAPTAPPTTPLPIPEKSARRRKARDTPGHHPQEKTTATQSPASTPLSRSPGLASSASIIPDLASNPNWPLPAPDASASMSVTADGGFGARRSLLRDKRSAPAPLNIAATRFAEDTGGPWTLGDAGSESRPEAAGVERKGSLIRVDTEFEWKEEYSTSSLDRQQQQQPTPADKVPSKLAAGDGESKAEAIGMARGLSLRYDQEREQQKRGRAKERMKLTRAWTIDETGASPTSPNAALAPGQPLDRTVRTFESQR